MEMKEKQLQGDSELGFTLIELLIAMLISGIVMASIYSAFQSQQNTYVVQDQVAEMQQNIRAGMNIMVREIRMAGYDPEDEAGATITTATSTSLTFTMVADSDGEDNDNDGTVDEAEELKTITYDHYDAYGDGDNDIGRQVGAAASTKRAIAENIDAIEFYYTLSDGTQTLAPANPDDIRSIQISVVARANHPDSKFTNTQTYVSASGATFDLNGTAAGLGNPANDNFRRRQLTTTVQCRNMGL